MVGDSGRGTGGSQYGGKTRRQEQKTGKTTVIYEFILYVDVICLCLCLSLTLKAVSVSERGN
jgi:hypothetical protein